MRPKQVAFCSLYPSGYLFRTIIRYLLNLGDTLKQFILLNLFLLAGFTFADIAWKAGNIALSAKHSKQKMVNFKSYLKNNCKNLRMSAQRPPAFVRFSGVGVLMKMAPLKTDVGEHSFMLSATCGKDEGAATFVDIFVEWVLLNTRHRKILDAANSGVADD